MACLRTSTRGGIAGWKAIEVVSELTLEARVLPEQTKQIENTRARHLHTSSNYYQDLSY